MMKKKPEVGSFTIVSKYPKGQKGNTIYLFKYQRDNKPRIYESKMVWLDFRLDKPAWAFMDGKEAQMLTNKEREAFINEIPKFQKGGSYRKTHPIARSESDDIRCMIEQKEKEIRQLKEKLNQEEDKHIEELSERYKKYLDKNKLQTFNKCLEKLKNTTDYVLSKDCFYTRILGTGVIILDKTNNIPVGILQQYNNECCVESLDDDDIKSLIRNNPKIRNMLEE